MKRVKILLIIGILFQLVIADIRPSFSENTGHGKIRELSLRRNDRIYNKMAIDLINGKSRQVSIDKMISLLKKYNVVEFTSDDMDPTKDLILREVAFRMLKDHYIPQIDDRIRVYRYSKDLAAETGIYSDNKSMLLPKVELSVGAATIKESKKMSTLYWADVVSQISSAVELLWINRINSSAPISSDNNNQASLFEVLGVLDSKYLYEKPTNKRGASNRSAAKIVVEAADEVLDSWSSKGIITDEEIPVLALLIRQYVILNISSDPIAVARQIKAFMNINILHNALMERIDVITQCIKVSNPSDYVVFAMLHSLLSEISDRILSLSENSAIGSSQLKAKIDKPRYSA